MPKNHTTPEGLKVFLNSIKSEINDPKKQKQRKLQFTNRGTQCSQGTY